MSNVYNNITKLSFSEDKEYEKSLRPKLLKDYIGQERIKNNLDVFISASNLRNESIDHILLFGSPGLGKTTLAFIIANELKTNIKVTSAPMIEKNGDLIALLSNLKEKEILFIDEIHRLSPQLEEILYTAMEDYRLDIIIGSGSSAQTIQIDIPKFTLIGATTKVGSLSMSLRERFGIQFRMEFYKNSELEEILLIASKKLNKNIDSFALHEIAKRSRGTPRTALRFFKRVRDFSDVKYETFISVERVIDSFELLGIDTYGLNDLDLTILRRLVEAKGKPVGIKTLSALLHEEIETIEHLIEPYLLSTGFIEKTARGRIATQKSYEIILNSKVN